MTAADLCFSTIEALGGLYRRREVSPVEVTRAVLERLHHLEPVLNAFITVLDAAALDAARRAEADFLAGLPMGPLHGVPLSLKDLFDTVGVRTTCASRILRDRVPDRDATVVARLPSGSGASVAAGVGFGSLGTDTGGSVRIPAAYCGIVGLKPTYGRVSRAGLFPLSWSLDHVGPMTRTGRDAAILLAAVAGPDPVDPTAAAAPVPDYAGACTGDVDGLRLGVVRWLADGPDLQPAVREAFGRAVRVLEDAGMAIEEVAIPDLAEARRTGPFNLTGHPAISVPCGVTPEGLPVGLQLAGPAWSEATLFRIADAYERRAGWTARRPPVG